VVVSWSVAVLSPAVAVEELVPLQQAVALPRAVVAVAPAAVDLGSRPAEAR